jgi:hypothetical protein
MIKFNLYSKLSNIPMDDVNLQIADEVIPVETEQPSENDNKISATTTVRIVKKRKKEGRMAFFFPLITFYIHKLSNPHNHMKTLNIEIPKGYEIDRETSTFEKIVFKEIKKEMPKSWYELRKIDGYYGSSATLSINKAEGYVTAPQNRSIFVTKEQVEAAIALAQLSQLRKVYRQGWEPDWNHPTEKKHGIFFGEGEPAITAFFNTNCFLSFQTEEIATQFLANFRDLIIKARPLMS